MRQGLDVGQAGEAQRALRVRHVIDQLVVEASGPGAVGDQVFHLDQARQVQLELGVAPVDRLAQGAPAEAHVGTLHGDKLTRVPRGFPADHPAGEYLKFRHFVAGAEFPPSLATSPAFYKTLLTVFRQVTPLARFLNTPLLKG